MSWSIRTVLVAGLIAAAIVANGRAQTPNASARSLYEEALHLQEVKGDLPRAIEIYRDIADRFATDPVAPHALLALASAYETLGRPEAVDVYRLVTSRYPSSGAPVTLARSKIESTQQGRGFSSRDILKFLDRVPNGLATAGLSRISPDGRWIAFTRGSGTQPAQAAEASLCLRDLRNGAERVILANVGGERPLPVIEWSGNSRRLAVSRQVSDATAVRREIIVIDVEDTSSQPIRFASVAVARQAALPRFPEPLTWSSDSRQLAFIGSTEAGTHELRVFDTSIGRSRSIAPVQPTFESTRSVTLPYLRWSPDHTEVAWQNGGDVSAGEVRIFGVADGRARTITLPAEPGQRALLTAWTPRGLVLRREPQAARASNVAVPLQTVLLDLATGRPNVVCTGMLSDNNAANPAGETMGSTYHDICLGVTSDGRRAMRWSSELQRVVLRDTSTGRDIPLTTGIGEERFANFINNDQTVVFLSNREGRWGIYAAPVAQAPLATPVLISALDDMPSGGALKPTSDGFVWSGNTGGWHLWRVDTDPVTGRAIGDPVELTPGAGDSILAAVSPDGRRVAYWSRRGYLTGLAVMDANGANKRIVKETDQPRFHNYGASPVWLSNDEILYADYSPRTEQRKFFVNNLRTGTNTPIPFPELQSAPANGMRKQWQFVAAQQEMVYLDRTNPSAVAVFRARPFAGAPDRTVATLNVPVSQVGDFLVAPDGGRIAYRSQGRWHVYDVATQALVSPAANVPAPADWSRDGRYLLTLVGSQPGVLDLETARQWPLPSSPLPHAWRPESAGDSGWWAPDRSYVILTLGTSRLVSQQWHGVMAEAVAKAAGGGK